MDTIHVWGWTTLNILVHDLRLSDIIWLGTILSTVFSKLSVTENKVTWTASTTWQIQCQGQALQYCNMTTNNPM